MSRRGDSIRKRKDGRWEGRYRSVKDPDGKMIYRSVYGRTYGEVKEKLKKISISEHYPKNYSGETIDDVAVNWLNNVKQYKKYSTYVKYENIYNKYIGNVLGEKRLSDITEEECVNFIDSMGLYRKNSDKLSISTLNSIRNVLTQIIKYGTKNTSFRINNTTKSYDFLTNEKENGVFTKSEQNQILNYLVTDIDNYKLGIIICWFTGMRLGEICALKRKNIDLINRTIQITETVQRIKSPKIYKKTELMVTTPKTINSNRTIPICDTLYFLLDRHLTEMPYVVNGDSVMEPRTYQYYFKNITKTLSIENKNFHCIRHTFATNCINNGMEIKCLSEILGHSDVKTTLNKYIHPTMEQKLNQINFISYDYGHMDGQAEPFLPYIRF